MPTNQAERPLILIAEPRDFSDKAAAILSEHGVVHRSEAGRRLQQADFNTYDAILTRLGTRIDSTLLGQSPRCRALGVPTTGLDHIDLTACAERGVNVVSLRGHTDFLQSIRATAEHALGLTLTLLRNTLPAAASVQAGHWDRDRYRGREIAGSTVGVVGMGRLGSIVADMFSNLGATVLGFDTNSEWTHATARPMKQLADLCERSSIVTIHVSYEPGDEPVIGYSELAAMRHGAILVNTSRGGAVDEAAILRALHSGQLAGAALDVLQGEPEVSTHPLVEYTRNSENLIITPHLGGNTFESLDRVEVFIARRIVDALQSMP